MSESKECKVDLRDDHLVTSAADVCSKLGRTADVHWSVGDARVTPKGEMLTGVRTATYACFGLGAASSSEEALANAVEFAKEHHAAVQDLTASGGEVTIVLWDFCADVNGVSLGRDELAELHQLGVSLTYGVVYSGRTPASSG